MPTNDRSATSVALSPRLAATVAALATLAAIAFAFVYSSAGEAASASGPVVSTAQSSLGRILVNSRGHTLYLFGRDRGGRSACSAKCASFWPPLIAAGKPRATAGAKASLLGTTRRPDGRMQVTYNHHPVYTFAKDARPGQTSGEQVNAFGGVWYAISPAGAKIVKGYR